MHFEVMSDLLLEREIRPIIHLKRHLSIFTFCEERRKVYSSGVYVCSKIFFAILHSLLHSFEFDERDGRKRVKSKGIMTDTFRWAAAGGGEWA